jgi:hypothetical protein
MDKQLYEDLIHYLTTLTYPDGYNEQRKTHLKRISTQYLIKNTQLYRQTKDGLCRVIQREQVEMLLFNLHKDMTGAHLGVEAVYNKLHERYFWPNMYDDVKEYIKNCDACQRRGPVNRKEMMIPIKVKAPFHRVGIDIKGPLPITSNNNRYIIVAMDYFTKWPEAKAIADIKAETVAKFIYEEIICRHGTPEELLSDRGLSFMNQVVDQLCTKFQVKHRLTSPYRPQTNGMIERFNRTLGECIAKLINDNDKEWDEYISSVLFAYRTMKHKSTGYSPFYLMYGRQAKLPVELKVETICDSERDMEEAILDRVATIHKMEIDQQDVLINIEQGQQKAKDRHDDQRVAQRLKISDKVLVERTWKRKDMSAKLENQWMGPYYIHDVIGYNNYKLRSMDGQLIKGTIHGNRLKIYNEHLDDPLVIIR